MTSTLATDLPRIRQHLQQLAPLPDSAWQQLAALFQPRQLAAGEYLVRVGEPSQYLAFVADGVLREYFMTRDGGEFNKAFVLGGSFTGSLYDLLSGEPSIAAIQALKPSRLLLAPFAEYQRLYAQDPCWDRLGRRFAEMLFMKKALREYEFLTMDASTRYLNLLQQYPDLEQQVTQYHIASYLGITPVALSRLRGALDLSGKPGKDAQPE